ncbi:response regulator [Reichenbachiella carrageenanivorans]|uniref:Response regulator n=1 Tax=Reichenbachiella carrageenanivorans TaxID=2979869 RepID=A0ABY6D596_9BACT|nr:response regulator [Reichenbachiella carrageenanivorans]UXX81342.1 response regulator [Reichenbachiella carrageenanivorans]
MIDINVISNILLVDDDPTSIFLQQHLLTDVCKYEGQIHACHNGRVALDYLENKGEYVSNGQKYPKPDLILLDINMPVMNGFEFLDVYKDLPEQLKGGIVISMLTSSLNKQDKDKADKYQDVSDFITKPITKKHLDGILANHFSNRK